LHRNTPPPPHPVRWPLCRSAQMRSSLTPSTVHPRQQWSPMNLSAIHTRGFNPPGHHIRRRSVASLHSRWSSQTSQQAGAAHRTVGRRKGGGDVHPRSVCREGGRACGTGTAAAFQVPLLIALRCPVHPDCLPPTLSTPNTVYPHQHCPPTSHQHCPRPDRFRENGTCAANARHSLRILGRCDVSCRMIAACLARKMPQDVWDSMLARLD
jgi:hypothetical protein